MKGTPFGNSARSVLFIVLVLAILGLMRCQEAKADTPPPTTVVEFGPSVLSADFTGGTVGLVSERFGGKWDIGLVLVGAQDCRCSEGRTAIPTNAAVRAMRVVRWKRLEGGLGVAYWSNTNRALGQRQTFNLMLGVYLTERLAIKLHHFSNAGQVSPNMGQDMITLAWKFER